MDWTRGPRRDARRVDLPTYAFHHQRYWPGPRADAAVNRPARPSSGRRRARTGALAAPASTWDRLARPGPAAWHAGVSRSPWLRYRGRLAARAPRTRLGRPDCAGRHSADVARGRRSPAAAGTLPGRRSRPRTDRHARWPCPPDGPAGVLSLLALDERAHPAHPAYPPASPAPLTLVQALGDAGVAAPLWCVTRGAVTVGARRDRLADARPGRASGASAGSPPWNTRDRWGGLVDLPAALDARAGARLAAVLTGGTAARTRSPSAPPASSPAALGHRARAGHRRRRRLAARAAPCWSPAAPARSARTWPAGWPPTAPRTWCWPAGAARTPRARPSSPPS